MNYKLRYGTTELAFSLDRTARKTLAIHVYPDSHIEVVAPDTASLDSIIGKVNKRRKWMYQKLLGFSRLPPLQPKAQFVTGETFRYLGRQYTLIVTEGRPKVNLVNGHLHLSCPANYSRERRELLLASWYRKRAREIFSGRLIECVRKTSIVGVDAIPVWKIKAMPKRWGSCTREKNIYLNPELVMAPKGCIDYVICHELCHIIEYNHSASFFELLSKTFPHWKKFRDQLNETTDMRMV